MNKAETLLFQRIQTGHLRMRNGEVEYYHFGHRRWHIKKPNQHPLSGRWRFMFSDGEGGRTSVYRNRLVWMIVNKQPIPDDCFVDHVDEDRMNDEPENLKLMKKQDSHLQGNGVQTYGMFWRLWKWFYFIEIYGRPPTEEEEGDDSLLFV